MVGKLMIEIPILWVCYALYMAVLVHKRGPIGGIFFYPKVMQERVIELELISEEELKKRRAFAYVLLLAWTLLIPLVMILLVNGARSYWDCCWQFYVLFLGAEFFDWLVIDTIWVALSDWWLIPGTEDLNDTWHSVHVKQWTAFQVQNHYSLLARGWEMNGLLAWCRDNGAQFWAWAALEEGLLVPSKKGESLSGMKLVYRRKLEQLRPLYGARVRSAAARWRAGAITPTGNFPNFQQGALRRHAAIHGEAA